MDCLPWAIFRTRWGWVFTVDKNKLQQMTAAEESRNNKREDNGEQEGGTHRVKDENLWNRTEVHDAAWSRLLLCLKVRPELLRRRARLRILVVFVDSGLLWQAPVCPQRCQLLGEHTGWLGTVLSCLKRPEEAEVLSLSWSCTDLYANSATTTAEYTWRTESLKM